MDGSPDGVGTKRPSASTGTSWDWSSVGNAGWVTALRCTPSSAYPSNPGGGRGRMSEAAPWSSPWAGMAATSSTFLMPRGIPLRCSDGLPSTTPASLEAVWIQGDGIARLTALGGNPLGDQEDGVVRFEATLNGTQGSGAVRAIEVDGVNGRICDSGPIAFNAGWVHRSPRPPTPTTAPRARRSGPRRGRSR